MILYKCLDAANRQTISTETAVQRIQEDIPHIQVATVFTTSTCRRTRPAIPPYTNTPKAPRWIITQARGGEVPLYKCLDAANRKTMATVSEVQGISQSAAERQKSSPLITTTIRGRRPIVSVRTDARQSATWRHMPYPRGGEVHPHCKTKGNHLKHYSHRKKKLCKATKEWANKNHCHSERREEYEILRRLRMTVCELPADCLNLQATLI